MFEHVIVVQLAWSITTEKQAHSGNYTVFTEAADRDTI